MKNFFGDDFFLAKVGLGWNILFIFDLCLVFDLVSLRIKGIDKLNFRKMVIVFSIEKVN